MVSNNRSILRIQYYDLEYVMILFSFTLQVCMDDVKPWVWQKVNKRVGVLRANQLGAFWKRWNGNNGFPFLG